MRDTGPTISELSRQTGIHRAAIACLIDAHEIETESVGPSTVITFRGMRRLQPLLDKVQAARARREASVAVSTR